MEHERTFLGLFWGCVLVGVLLCATELPQWGEAFFVAALILAIPYAVGYGILADPKDKDKQFPEC